MNQAQSQQSVDNGVIVFTVNISRWSANKKLRVQHTKATADELPPADLHSLGVRKVFDPKALAPFEAIRKEVERLCFSEGTSFFGGVAVPKSEADGFAKKLKSLQERFNVAKSTFEHSYESSLEAWRNAHAGWEHTMEGALSASEALNRFHFGFHAVEIVMTGNVQDAKSELEQNIASSKGAFVGQMYSEIAQMAVTYRKESLLGKEKATARGLSALQAMRKKLNGLAFLDSRIRPLVGMIDTVMAQLPSSGSIDGAQFTTLMGVTSILSDQDTMQQYGDQVNAGKDANSLFCSLTAPAQAVAAPAMQAAVPVVTVPTAAKPGLPSFKPAAPSAPRVPGSSPIPAVGSWGSIPSRVAVAA